MIYDQISTKIKSADETTNTWANIHFISVYLENGGYNLASNANFASFSNKFHRKHDINISRLGQLLITNDISFKSIQNFSRYFVHTQRGRQLRRLTKTKRLI